MLWLSVEVSVLTTGIDQNLKLSYTYKFASYRGKWHGKTARSSPPSRHVYFTRHSPVRGPLVCKPVNCSKRFAISLLVSPGLCNANCKIVFKDFLNPSNNCFMDICGICEVHVIDRNLYVNRFVRIKDVRSQWDLLTNRFSPNWIVAEAMATLLRRESCKKIKHTRSILSYNRPLLSDVSGVIKSYPTLLQLTRVYVATRSSSIVTPPHPSSWMGL